MACSLRAAELGILFRRFSALPVPLKSFSGITDRAHNRRTKSLAVQPLMNADWKDIGPLIAGGEFLMAVKPVVFVRALELVEIGG